MEKRIFISHSSKDHDTAALICDALEKNGLLCWIAPRDIPYGKEWAGEIAKAIENSSAFLFLSSGNSNASGQVSREIQLAIENEVPIIPIRLDGADYSDTNKYYLATIHCMFQYDASKVAKLVSDIADALPQSAKQSAEEKKEKQKKVKKPKYGLKLSLCGVFTWACALAAMLTFVLSDLELLYKILIAAAAVIFGNLPLFIIRHKALKSFKINGTTVNALTAVFLCGVIGIAGSGFALDHYLWYSDLDTKYHIVLTAPENMTAAEFKDATERVTERVHILSDGKRYTVDANGDEIELIIPRETFGEITLNDMLKCYISRATVLYFTTNTVYDIETGKDIIQQVEIPRESITSVTVKQGTIPGVEDISEYDIENTESYEYLEIVLDEKFVKDNKDTLDFYGEKLVIAQDKVGNDNYYYYHTFRDKKANVFYILSEEKHSTVGEVIAYNLTHEPLADSLYIKTAIAAVWENVKDAEIKGKNQCNVKDLKGETVTIKYKASTYSQITEGEWSDTTRAFKARLDALGQPYAFGSAYNEPNTITVRTSPERLNENLMHFISERQPAIKGGYSKADIPNTYSDDYNLKVISDEKGIYVQIDALDEDDEKIFRQLAANAAANKSDRIYLADEWTGVNILSGVASENSKGDSLRFNEITFMPEKTITEENRWVVDLVEAVYCNSLKTGITYSEFNFSDFTETEEKTFALNPDLADLKNKISEIADVRFVELEQGTLKVALNLEVNEELPEKAIEIAKKIYKLTDFENSDFESLYIYPIEEVGKERVRIFFSKHYETLASYKEEFNEGYIYAHGLFAEGRVDRDKEVFLKLVSEDEFFQKLDHTQDDRLGFKIDY